MQHPGVTETPDRLFRAIHLNMSELRHALSEPRSASHLPAPALPLAAAPPRATRKRGTVHPLFRAAVSLLPWLLLGAGCLSEEDTGDPALEPGDTVGQGTTSAGAGGSTAQGTGGSQSGNASGTGGSTTQASGGSSSMPVGSGGNMSLLDAAPGETGIFVGMTAAHNVARRSLDLDPPLPDLTWSEELAEFAQEWAETLVNDDNCGTIFHRMQSMYGENIALRGSRPLRVEYAPEEAVESWFSEIDCWEYGTIRGSESCDMVCIDELRSSGCGHFTQIAWRNTQQVGCGYATCDEDGWTNEVWVCNYDPPGNFVGQTPF